MTKSKDEDCGGYESKCLMIAEQARLKSMGWFRSWIEGVLILLGLDRGHEAWLCQCDEMCKAHWERESASRRSS